MILNQNSLEIISGRTITATDGEPLYEDGTILNGFEGLTAGLQVFLTNATEEDANRAHIGCHIEGQHSISHTPPGGPGEWVIQAHTAIEEVKS